MNEPGGNDGIAIVGMAGRFPGARDVAQFWANLCAGRESIATFTDEQLLAAGVTPEDFNDPSYVRCRAILDEPDCFDAEFFGVTARDAALMDPQHRLFLECCWHALENAGQSPRQGGSVGVFASSSLNTYALRQVLGNRRAIAEFTRQFQADGYNILLGADKDYLATRVAYKLNLRGPALTIQTACSSSLVAVAQACSALQLYQCDAALAGGVSLSFPQERGHLYQEGAIASADGHCRAFDAAAQGTVFGAGCGIVLLKRLEDALRDRNGIYAVIRSTAVNNDGADKMSYSAPSQNGQTEVIALAHALAGVTADSISYVEAHGTGTPLGDPVEVGALTEAFRTTTSRTTFCGLGSLKTNVGHLEAAAGVTGLIKAALALRHRFLPASLHFQAPNPGLNLAASPFYVNAAGKPWDDVPLPRRAGVSSFGVGGTNAHAVLEEAPAHEPSGTSRSHELLVLSAKTPAALATMGTNLADWLAAPPPHVVPDGSRLLADVAFTLQCGRQALPHRRAVVARDAAEAEAGLRGAAPKQASTGSAPTTEPEVIFLFPGQGAQQPGMGRELYENEPVFRAGVDHCAEGFQQLLGFDLRAILYPAEATPPAVNEKHPLDDTRVTQPAIFAVEYALAALWQSWGIKPAVVIGHSIGEYVCAVLAGTFTLEHALGLLAKRAQLMHNLPRGSMLAVRLAGEELAPELPPDVSIAAYNSDRLCTVSGPSASLKRFQAALESRKIACRPLPTSHAFHSAMMEPIVPDFTAAVAAVTRENPRLRWLSTCTGTWMNAENTMDASYWARQLRGPVRFAGALDAVADDPRYVMLEVGPGQSLSQLVRQHPRRPPGQVVATSLGTSGDSGGGVRSMLAALGQMWVAGVNPDWEQFHAGRQRLRVPLPPYPFARTRHWAEPVPDNDATSPHAAAGTAPATNGSPEAGFAGVENENGSDLDSKRLEALIQSQLAAMRQQLQLWSRR